MLVLQLLSVMVMFVVVTGPHVSAGAGHRHLAAAWNTLFNTPVANRPRNCEGCAARRVAMEHTVSNLQLTALRIQFIKQQILQKLRLKEPPNVKMPLSSLPLPLTNGTILSSTKERLPPDNEVDDYYGKTDQVILFPKEDIVRCTPATQNPSACFPFQLPAELVSEDVTTAELWIYKEEDRFNRTNHKFVVSEVAHRDLNRSLHKTKHIATHATTIAEGWVKINLLWPIKNWLDFQELFHAIHIECPTCTMEVGQSPISIHSKHKPFLVINTNSISKTRRLKRKLNCLPGVTECCRETLYISFADIGWDDWILQPSGYHAFFCRGSCSNAASLTVSSSYGSIVRKLLHQSSPSRRLELVPCCTATRLSSIQLLYVDNNETYTQKTLPNMVVDSCGCM